MDSVPPTPPFSGFSRALSHQIRRGDAGGRTPARPDIGRKKPWTISNNLHPKAKKTGTVPAPGSSNPPNCRRVVGPERAGLRVNIIARTVDCLFSKSNPDYHPIRGAVTVAEYWWQSRKPLIAATVIRHGQFAITHEIARL